MSDLHSVKEPIQHVVYQKRNHKMRRSGAPSQVAKRGRMAPARKKTPMYKPVKGKFGAQAFPKQLFNTMRYVDLINIPQTTGAGRWQFSCNGLYDPNITGTGSQPMYFDQLVAIYDHYTVLKSRMKLTIFNNTDTTTNYTLYIDDDTTSNNTAYVAAQYDTASTRFEKTQVKGAITLYKTWDASKMFGPNPQAQDSLQGTSSANPTEQSYFTIIILDQGLTTGTTCSALVEIDYSCVWDEYVTTPAS